jgi:23S rRNA (uracil1939-C5)-methyltransferase
MRNERHLSHNEKQHLVSISSLAPGGCGVAHVVLAGERRAVFIPRSAPGDVARIEVDASRRPARGRLLALVTPAPQRVTPACAWSDACGACDWMHLSIPAQREAHTALVRAALPPSWRDCEIAPIAAPGGLGYRTRTRVHVRCDRDGRPTVGMHEQRSHTPVHVDCCAVLDPAVECGRAALAALLRGSAGRGEVTVSLGPSRRPVVDIGWAGELANETFARLERAVAAGELSGARVTIAGARRPATIGDPTPWMTGADGAPLRLPPGGFAQANELVNAQLVRHVAEVVRPLGVDDVVELFAGAGNLSVLLARTAGRLTCVEADRDACDAARANLAARSLQAVVHEGDASAYTWSRAARLLVMDPPRVGARETSRRLVASRVAHVVYVSCDTQTLGRDLAILETAYRPTSIATFEMFPQTSHVETVVALQRRAA